MSATETLKISIENAMRKVSFKISSNSNFSIFEVGTHKMGDPKIVDNILSAIEQLKDKWPGGWKNIKRLYLKPMIASKVSIPIYYSKINPNDVEVPVEVGVKQTRLDKLTEELAKQSKKLRIDKKTKKLVKVKGEAPPSKDKDKKKKKDKKRKLEGKEVKTEAEVKKEAEVKTEAVDENDSGETKPKKKKKKTSVSEAPEAAGSKVKKEKNAVSVAIVDAPQEGKKKKNKKSKSESEATDVKPAAASPAKAEKTKKKKNKNKKVKATVEDSD